MSDRTYGTVALRVAAILLATVTSVSAASVFMKNGYIIQGPVVERDEHSIVLGWPNGKVLLARRFVEQVSYDPGEEKRLEDLERSRKEELSTVTEASDLAASGSDAIQLPSTLDELMKSYNLTAHGTAATPESPLAVDPVAAGVVGTPSTSGSVVPVLIDPDGRLQARLVDPARGISIRPPLGWQVRQPEQALCIAGPAASDGFVPSMNVVVLAKGPVSAQDYGALLKQENAQRLESYELIHEGYRDVGAQKGLQLVGRGTYAGRTAFVRQVLVVGQDRVWLLSTFTEDQASQGGSFALTEESANTIEFTDG